MPWNRSSCSPDQPFSKGTNYYWVDWDAPVPPNPLTLKRRFLPWDLDTVMTAVDDSIYGQGPPPGTNLSDIQDIILGHPTFGAQYDRIMCELLAGPLQTSTLTSLVTDVETLISVPLAADPNNNIGDATAVADHFNTLRQYMTDRRQQRPGRADLHATACTADIDCDDGNECTDDACDLDTGFCMPPANNTTPATTARAAPRVTSAPPASAPARDTCTAGFACDAGAERVCLRADLRGVHGGAGRQQHDVAHDQHTGGDRPGRSADRGRNPRPAGAAVPGAARGPGLDADRPGPGWR